MSEDAQFESLLQRVRKGEPQAARELVRRYESAVRVAVRTHLSDPKLKRQFDSVDISQSVLASFFIRAAAGQYDLQEPQQLVALLTRMASNKLAMQVRRQHQKRRDVRRTRSISGQITMPADASPGPDERALQRDLLDRAYQLMSPEVRKIADSRAKGGDWNQIAAQLGGTAEARRKQSCRAMDEIAQTLQIE